MDIARQWFKRIIRAWEGDAALRPANEDPGGYTNHGITEKYWINSAHAIVNKPATREALSKITWDDAAKISLIGFWKKWKIDRVSNPALREFVADAYWLGGGIKSLGYNSIAELNRDPFLSAQKLYDNRMRYLRSLSNWEPNKHGWTNRMNDVLKMAKAISKRRLVATGSIILVAGICAVISHYNNDNDGTE